MHKLCIKYAKKDRERTVAMKEPYYNPAEKGLSNAFLNLLGLEDRIVLQISETGAVVWQTEAAMHLLELELSEEIGQVLSEKAAHAVLRAAQEGSWLTMEEEIEESLWRLKTHPLDQGGLLLLLEPLEDRERAENAECIRNHQIRKVVNRLVHRVNVEEEKAEDEQARENWQWILRQIYQIWRINLHGEILNREKPLDEKMVVADLKEHCQRLANAVSEIANIEIEVHGAPTKAVISIQELECIVLNLLTNAVRQQPEKIWMELSKMPGRIRLIVAHQASADTKQVKERLDGWKGLTQAHRPGELAKMGLGLPVVQTLLGQRGGSLLADVEGTTTRFIAILPDDLCADPPMLNQCSISSGMDLLKIELSVLEP